MKETKSILFIGVGGQGTILASKILSEGLLRYGYDVKMSEVHGMAQRGGSVTTQVRFGETVHSPLVEIGKADAIVAFEKSEALRSLNYLKKDGYLIVNDYEIHPVPVLIGAEKYPDGVEEALKAQVENTVMVKAAEIAQNLGNIKAQNVVLLGALIKALNIEEVEWNEVMKTLVPAKAIELNEKALEAGMDQLTTV
ncbi:MAG: indolepyruvate oxidoreductase subunit beta [Clostridium sp.]